MTEGSAAADMDEEIESASSCTCSETGDSEDQHQQDNKGSESLSSHYNSHEVDDDLDLEATQNVSSSPQYSRQCTNVEVIGDIPDQVKNNSKVRANERVEQVEDDNPEINSRDLTFGSIQRSTTIANEPVQNSKRPTVWGRSGAKKNLSMENIDVPIDNEDEIQRLEDMKVNLENEIPAEKKENAVLLEDLEKRKNALHKRRLALEQNAAKLQEQLQKEKELRASLEAGLKKSKGPPPTSASINETAKADLEEIAQAETSNQGRVKDKEKEKEKDFEASASSRNVDKSMGSMDNQDQLPDSLHNLKTASPLVEQWISSSSITNSRRSAPRGEVGPTSYALTKLTNRLNFLKERRNQMANELQNMDKGQNSAGQAAQKQEIGSSWQSESPPPITSTNKFKESESQSSEKGRAGTDSNQGVTEGSSFQNADNTHRKLDIHSLKQRIGD